MSKTSTQVPKPAAGRPPEKLETGHHPGFPVPQALPMASTSFARHEIKVSCGETTPQGFSPAEVSLATTGITGLIAGFHFKLSVFSPSQGKFFVVETDKNVVPSVSGPVKFPEAEFWCAPLSVPNKPYSSARRDFVEAALGRLAKSANDLIANNPADISDRLTQRLNRAAENISAQLQFEIRVHQLTSRRDSPPPGTEPPTNSRRELLDPL